MAKKNKAVQYVEYCIVQIFCFIIRILPYWAALKTGEGLGLIAGNVFGLRRKVLLDNLSIAFPDKSLKEKQDIAYGTWKNIGRNLIEFIRLPGLSHEDLHKHIIWEGRQYLDEALSRGKGVILVTAHFGIWDLTGASMAKAGYPLCIVARTMDNKLLDTIATNIRKSSGAKVIFRRNGIRHMLKCIKQNMIVGILMDQNMSSGIAVDFFSKAAATTPVAGYLTLKTGAPVIPVHGICLGYKKYKIIFEPEVVYKNTHDKDKDIQSYTLRLNKLIQSWIISNPDHWFWVHNRWKKRPFQEGDSG